jgi:hypothetical protein
MAGKIIRPDDWDEGTLFHAPLHREPDRPTSVQGARDVKHRRTSQAMLLLIEYRNHDLTDEEAGARSGLLRRSPVLLEKVLGSTLRRLYRAYRSHEDRFRRISTNDMCHYPRGPQGS